MDKDLDIGNPGCSAESDKDAAQPSGAPSVKASSLAPAEPQPEKQYNDGAADFARAAWFEKVTILTPALTEAFNKAARETRFDRTKDKIIDIGCGPFFLSLPFLRDHIHIDGVDIAPKMIEEAKKTLAHPNVPKNGTLLAGSYKELHKEEYGFAMLNFVHPCCASKIELEKLFKEAHDLLRPGARLILTGAHPEYLHIPHAACEYDVREDQWLEEGEVYTGAIFDAMGQKMFELRNDHFWSSGALMDAARKAGFGEHIKVEEIKDHSSFLRPASQEAAYIMMTFTKPPKHSPAPGNP